MVELNYFFTKKILRAFKMKITKWNLKLDLIF